MKKIEDKKIDNGELCKTRLSLDTNLYEELNTMAKSKGISFNEIFIEALSEFIEKNNYKGDKNDTL